MTAKGLATTRRVIELHETYRQDGSKPVNQERVEIAADGPTSPRRVLELHKLCRQYGDEPAVHALVDVDLSLDSGGWLSITGPSGAGKSTLLNIIGCLDHPTSGSYFLDGIDTAELNDRQRAGLRSQRIGFVFQAFQLLPYRSVLENVMLAEVYRKKSQKDRRARALAAIERVGLTHRADFLPTKLSGGENQIFAIRRASMGSPSLLLCDEPTGNLDSKSSAALLDLFEKLNQDGLTLVVVTHDENVARRAARRVNIVDGSLTDVSNGANVRKSASSPVAAVNRTVVRSGIMFRDLLNEALAGMFARPGRMVLTILGIVIGLTALVATLGLTRTAGNRIISQFDRLAATELFIKARPGRTTGIVDPKAIPWDAPTRLRRLNGVVAVGTMSEVDVGGALISASPVKNPLNQSAFKLAVYAASPDLFRAVRAEGDGEFPISAIRIGRTGSRFSVRTLPGALALTASNNFRQFPSAIISTWSSVFCVTLSVNPNYSDRSLSLKAPHAAISDWPDPAPWLSKRSLAPRTSLPSRRHWHCDRTTPGF